MDKFSLKHRLVKPFATIFLLSLILTGITLFFSFKFLISEETGIYPADYYKRKIPDIESYLQKKGLSLLNPDKNDELIVVIPKEGIAFQVLDAKGRYLYGSLKDNIIQDEKDLYTKMNTTIDLDKNYFCKVIPIIDNQGKIAGAALLSYRLQVTFPKTPRHFLILAIYILTWLSPFIYILLFTYITYRRFIGRITNPIVILIQAVKKIKDKDFDLDNKTKKELAQLFRALHNIKEKFKEGITSNLDDDMTNEES